MIKGWVGVLAATLAGVLAVAVVPALQAGPVGAAARGFSVSRIAWQECSRGSAPAVVGGFTCATVRVPLDYRHPSGPTIRLVVVRHAATGHRRGVIVLNPGGPSDQSHVAVRGVDRVRAQGAAA